MSFNDNFIPLPIPSAYNSHLISRIDNWKMKGAVTNDEIHDDGNIYQMMVSGTR